MARLSVTVSWYRRPFLVTHGLTIMLACLLALTTAAGVAHAQITLGQAVDLRRDALPSLAVADGVAWDSVLAPAFRSAVGGARIAIALQGLWSQYGNVIAVRETQRTSERSLEFELDLAGGYTLAGRLRVEALPPFRYESLWIGEPRRSVSTMAALVTEFAALPGTTSFLAARIARDSLVTLASYQSDSLLPVASAAKIYTLGALIDAIAHRKRSWSDVIRLRREAQSHPAGILQTWPADAPITLYSLAGLMMSLSDNTAADNLVLTLGAPAVEAAVARMGHSRPQVLQPFLTTRAVFALRASPDLDRFREGTPAARREIVRAHEVDSLPSIATVLAVDNRGLDIDWYASASDLARAWHWLHRATGAKQLSLARDLLQIGSPPPDSTWAFRAHKPGSEPGAWADAALLERRDGARFVVVLLNRAAGAQDAARLQALFSSAAHALAAVTSQGP